MNTSGHCRRWILACLLYVGAAWAGAEDEPQTVSRVDLDRYLGRWYEIARLPNRFQDHCVADVSAEYRLLQDGDLRVINRCLEEGGVLDEAWGVARVVDTGSNARLKVSFVSLFGWHLFWGDYWIIGLADDYGYAVIGTPDRDYGWVLSRTPSLSASAWAEVRQLLVTNGYDPERFVFTPKQAPGKGK
jgi:apolipoprotein D and lipocalin family protein